MAVKVKAQRIIPIIRKKGLPRFDVKYVTNIQTPIPPNINGPNSTNKVPKKSINSL
jgi:hypothetical protein